MALAAACCIRRWSDAWTKAVALCRADHAGAVQGDEAGLGLTEAISGARSAAKAETAST
jgi:hypothetical protein